MSVPHADRMPGTEFQFAHMREKFLSLARFYGFERMVSSFIEDPAPYVLAVKNGLFEERTPLMCHTASGGEMMARPNVVLPILRAYVSEKMNDLPHPLKFSAGGESIFLHGPSKEFRSVEEEGLVIIGEEGPIAEAEIIQVIAKTIEELGIEMSRCQLAVNATGCTSCRVHYRAALGTYYRSRQAKLCKHCKRHFKRTPTKMLLCREEKCAQLAAHAPQVLDYLCEECKKHLCGFLEFLDEMRVPYFLDTKLFREGSWFYQIIFEFTVQPHANTETSGEHEERVGLTHGGMMQGVTVAEGGRMSRLGEFIVGRRLDVAAGFFSLANFLAILADAGIPAAIPSRPRVFLAQLGELAKRKSIKLLEILRKGEIDTRESLGRDALKSQLKVAELIGAEIALVLGQKEALDETIIVRDVASGMQETIAQDKLIEFFRKKMKKPIGE